MSKSRAANRPTALCDAERPFNPLKDTWSHLCGETLQDASRIKFPFSIARGEQGCLGTLQQGHALGVISPNNATTEHRDTDRPAVRVEVITQTGARQKPRSGRGHYPNARETETR